MSTAERVLHRLYVRAVEEGFRDHARARLRQIAALSCGKGIAELAAIWRREMDYLPCDKLRELRWKEQPNEE